MKPEARYIWIEIWMRDHGGCCYAGQYALAIAYVQATKAKFDIPSVNPMRCKCPQLRKDLRAMHKAGTITRYDHGLKNLSHKGMAKWLRVYRVIGPHFG